MTVIKCRRQRLSQTCIPRFSRSLVRRYTRVTPAGSRVVNEKNNAAMTTLDRPIIIAITVDKTVQLNF